MIKYRYVIFEVLARLTRNLKYYVPVNQLSNQMLFVYSFPRVNSVSKKRLTFLR